MCLRVFTFSKNFEFGYFTLLFCRGRQRNEPEVMTHVQSHGTAGQNLFICDVLVAVVVYVQQNPANSNSQGNRKTFELAEIQVSR